MTDTNEQPGTRPEDSSGPFKHNDTDNPPSYDEICNQRRNTMSRICQVPIGKWGLSMLFLPYGGSRDNLDTIEGSFSLLTDDLPALMRNGLHWDVSNVTDCQYRWDKSPIRKGRHLTLHFTLRDMDRSDCPLWTANLSMTGYEEEFDPRLYSFNITDLTVKDVDYAEAHKVNTTGPDELCYHFDRMKPSNNLNTIYGEMTTLEGWWPWPRGV